MRAVLGLDIGGANLKAAHTDGRAVTRPFPLWRAPDQLAAELRQLLAALPPYQRLAVTMTGELCDCFTSKAEGVRAILRAVEEVARTPIDVWTTAGAFVDLATAHTEPQAVAAANWLALGHLAARLTEGEPALLIDTGSTTTDLLYLDHRQPQPRGRTDLQRLAAGELVYTGVRRTPVCAVLGMEVAAEFFATMLDVYLILGLVAEMPQDTGTADGRPATRPHAHARLARLRCAGIEEFPEDTARMLAQQALEQQLAHVCRAMARVLHDRPAPRSVMLSGSGEILGRLLCARHLHRQPTALSDRLGTHVSEAATAYAVAVLAQEGRR